jgi:hypothetical protein
MDADGHGSGRFNPDSESGPRRNAADAATKGFEQEHTEETERNKNFVENAQFLGIALQSRHFFLFLASLRLGVKDVRSTLPKSTLP